MNGQSPAVEGQTPNTNAPTDLPPAPTARLTPVSFETRSPSGWALEAVPRDPSTGPALADEGAFRPSGGTATAAAPETYLDVWTAPEWAEPEADATLPLALLRYLPAHPPAAGRVSSLFGRRRAPHDAHGGRLQFHEGLDVAVPIGTPVVAPGPGVVVGAGYGHRFGTYVRIRHENVGLETLLAHLSSVEKDIRRGVRVRRGEVVGRSGNSGWSTGPHLHFEFRTVRKQLPINPLKVYALYFRALDRVADFPIASVHAQMSPYRIDGTLWKNNSTLRELVQNVP